MGRSTTASIGIALKFKLKDIIDSLTADNYTTYDAILSEKSYIDDEGHYKTQHFHNIVTSTYEMEFNEYKAFLLENLNKEYTDDLFDDTFNLYEEANLIYSIEEIDKLESYILSDEAGTNIKSISTNKIIELANNNKDFSIDISLLPPYEKVFYIGLSEY